MLSDERHDINMRQLLRWLDGPLHAMILVSTVFKNLWTADFASAILAGLVRAATLFCMGRGNMFHNQVTVTAIPC